MKSLVEQPTYPLYNNQERIEFLQANQLSDDKDRSSSIESLQTVLANTFFSHNKFLNKSENILTNYFNSSINENQFNHFYSSLSKRIQTDSLPNHSTMAIPAITNFSEEQTNSIEYDNTYLSSEETSRLDDISSLTTITSNLPKQFNSIQQNTSVYSDTDDISEEITSDVKQYNDIHMSFDLQNPNIKSKDEKIIPAHINLPPTDCNFTGLVHAVKCTIIEEKETDDEQTLSDYDNVNHYSEHNNKISSSIDIVSLKSSITSTMQYNPYPMIFLGEQLNKQERTSTSEDDDDDNDDDDDYIIVDQQKPIVQLTMMNNESKVEIEEVYDDDDEYFESTRLFDNEQLNGNLSDQSQYSDDLRYPSDVIENCRTSEDRNNTSSTLRQEAISITKVRCKQRNTWIRSSTSFKNNSTNILSKNSDDGTDVGCTSLNANMNLTTCGKIAPTMLLHKNSVDCNKIEEKNGETPSYGFLQVNHDHRSLKTGESIVSPLLKTNSIHDKDVLSTSRKTDNFYLIHHQSSLIPIKDLLHKNIEIIQMDEEECILEIVDGVVTLIPKGKSTLSMTTTTTSSDEDKSEEQQKNTIDYQTKNNYEDSPKRVERSSSITSSISTPSISEHEREPDQEIEQDEILSSSSRLSFNKEEEEEDEEEEDSQEPFILIRDIPSKSPPLISQTEQSVDLLDLFSTPLVPLSNSNTDNNNNNNKKYTKNLLDDSLSSNSSYEINNPNNNSSSDSSERNKIRSSSPKIQNQSQPSSPSISIKDDIPAISPPNETSTPPESIQTVEKPSEIDYPIPKTEPPPNAKPINKARINEFASLLSSSVHLIPPQAIKKQETPKTIPTIIRPPPSPSRSDDQSYSSIPSATTDRDERESYHTVQSNNNSEQEQNKKPIDARYNEKIDDRKSIKINTSNIKALFEQKISDTNRILSQSSEQLLHLTETKQQNQQHKKVPISYGSLKRNLLVTPQQTNPITTRRQSYTDFSNMNKYTDHIVGTKDVVIEDKQPENGRQTQQYGNNMRRNNTEEIIRPGAAPSKTSPDTIPNGSYSESLIAREIRETQEKEEELKRQRKKCGLPEDLSTLLTIANNDPIKPDTSSSTKQPVKSSSFLSNLDYFTSKANNSTQGVTSPRRSTTVIQNLVYDSNGTSTNDELKQINSVVSQELNRFNDSGIPIIRTSSTNNFLQRSSSNQNILSAQNTNNIIQREIEAIRAKEAELRQLGRIQHTSDEHSDPRKYQEYVPPLPKSYSSNALSTGKVRRDTERITRPVIATSNGFLQPKSTNHNSSVSSVRGKFPSPNPTAPIISSSNKSTDYSKLSSTDRLELEKRECQEREQELKKQRHSVVGATSSVNGDSGNVSQDEHDEDQERYFDKIERLKRKENEKAQAPLIRPTKKLDMSQRWEQMLTHKNVEDTTGDDNDD